MMIHDHAVWCGCDFADTGVRCTLACLGGRRVRAIRQDGRGPGAGIERRPMRSMDLVEVTDRIREEEEAEIEAGVEN